MTDVNRVPEVEMLDQLVDIGGIGVHVITAVGLARASMAAAIMRDDAIDFIEKEDQLVVPVVSAQRPAVVEDDWLGVLWPPVLVENLGAVAGRDEGHGTLLMIRCRPGRTGAAVAREPMIGLRLGPETNAAYSS